MARARNLKPSFFTNDELAEIAPLGRLLFQGLWCLADRAGRLEDRPKKIKAELLPYDDCNVDELLQALDLHGFIHRYEVGGTRFIQVVNFAKHQNPHVKEAESTIPAPCKNSAGTVHEQEIPERAGLIPDSLNPLIDSLNPITDSSTGNPDGLLADSAADDGKPNCPHQQIIALYHEVLPMCPQIRDWTPARATQLRARWNEDEKRQSLDYWKSFFGYVAECDFLVGKGSGNKPFFADLEWLVKQANFTKVREGKYENRGKA